MRPSANKRILVVEDDRPIADLLKHHFENAGFSVTVTADGDCELQTNGIGAARAR